MSQPGSEMQICDQWDGGGDADEKAEFLSLSQR